MNNLSKLIDFIKLSPLYLFAISISTGVLIYLDNSPIVIKMGLSNIANNYRFWFGLTFLISTSLLIVHAIKFIYLSIINLKDNYNNKKIRIERLKNLTPKEKNILANYFSGNTRSQTLDYTDGTVRELELMQIIYRSSEVSRIGAKFSYNIQPWAWDYLKKNPDLYMFKIDEVNLQKRKILIRKLVILNDRYPCKNL